MGATKLWTLCVVKKREKKKKKEYHENENMMYVRLVV